MPAVTDLIIMEINPPVRHSPWLWLVGALCLVIAVLLGLLWRWLVRHWGREDAERQTAGLERLRAEALRRISEVENKHRVGGMSDREVHQELSAIVRRFVGTASGGDADFQVLAELREAAATRPMLAPVVEFVQAGYAASFAPDAEAPVADALARAREVVTTWT